MRYRTWYLVQHGILQTHSRMAWWGIAPGIWCNTVGGILQTHGRMGWGIGPGIWCNTVGGTHGRMGWCGIGPGIWCNTVGGTHGRMGLPGIWCNTVGGILQTHVRMGWGIGPGIWCNTVGGIWSMGHGRHSWRQLALQTHVVRSGGAYLAQMCHRMGTGCHVRAMGDFMMVSLRYAL